MNHPTRYFTGFTLLTLIVCFWSTLSRAAETPASISGAPYLRSVMPDDALAYIRIPNPWGLVGAPKGNFLSKALDNQPFRDTLGLLRTALEANLLASLDPPDGPLLRALFARMRSPLELMVLAPAPGGAAPLVLLAVALDSSTVDEVNTVLREITAEAGPMVQFDTELDPSGIGALALPGPSAQLYFDTASRRLYALVEQGPPTAALQQTVAELAANPSPPIAALESEIDQSGQGLFAWLNFKPFAQMAGAMLPPEQTMMLQATGADQIGQVAVGTGVSDGKGRVKVVVEMPAGGWRSLLPMMDSELAVEIAAEVKLLGIIGIPSAEGLRNMEGFLQAMQPEVAEGLQKIREAFMENTGISLDDWLNLFGPEIVGISDAAGEYGAIKLRDEAKWAEIVELLQERHGFRNETREIDGQTYSHLIVPNSARGVDETNFTASLLSQAMSPVPEHVYWKVESGYLLMAQIPQVLIERDRLANKVTAGQWLEQTQKLPGNNSLFLLSGRSNDVPQMMYGINLQLLQMFGDLIQQPVDLFQLPAPSQLDLPKQGAYGLKLVSNERRLALELAYESSPIEILLAGGGFGTIAAVGVVAAVALPAYQDYTVRAEVASVLGQASGLKLQLTEFHAANGRFPGAEELEQIGSEAFGLEFEIEPETGEIILYVEHDRLWENYTLYLTPEADGGAVNWECSSEIDYEYLPSACR